MKRETRWKIFILLKAYPRKELWNSESLLRIIYFLVIRWRVLPFQNEVLSHTSLKQWDSLITDYNLQNYEFKEMFSLCKVIPGMYDHDAPLKILGYCPL